MHPTLLRSSPLLFLMLAICPGESKIASTDYVKANLGTKGNYSPQQNSANYTPPPPTCRLGHIEYIARHGTREPTGGKIESLSNLQQSISDFVSAGGQFNEPYTWMATWTNPYVSGQAGLLSVVGEYEHYETAKRMLKNYDPILNLTYNPNRYDFRETQVSRTGVSASSFAYGMMEGRGTLGPSRYAPPYIWSMSKSQDSVLRFFDICSKYLSSVLNNETAYQQETYFTFKLQKNAFLLSNRLGTAPLWEITVPQMLDMWEACRSEASLLSDYSHFCSIWTEDDVDDLAFREDLDFYYKRGYGHPLNYQIAVDLMKDITSDISKALSSALSFYDQCPLWLRRALASELLLKSGAFGTEEEVDAVVRRSLEQDESCQEMAKNIPYQLTASFRFAHAETLIPLLAWLSLYPTDQSLMKFDTPPSVRSQRAWKTSEMSPYSSNVNFATYVCEGDDGEAPYALLKVLHNEREVVINGCDSVYCRYSQFLALFNDLLSLDFKTICN